MREMKLQDLKSKSPTELLAFAEEHQVENASTMRKQEQMFAILKQLAAKEIDIIGEGVVATNLIDMFGRKAETPAEVGGGLRFHLPWVEGLQATVGGSVGLTFGYGAPDYRAILGVSYLKPRRVDLPEPPPLPQEEVMAKVTEEKIEITRKVHFEFDRAVIRPISFPILDAVVSILREKFNARLAEKAKAARR